MFKCSVCFEKLSDTNIVWIGACGHFCCAKCSAVVEKVPDKYDYVGQILPKFKVNYNVSGSRNVEYHFCKCGRVFEIVEDSTPTSLEQAIQFQQNIVLLNVKENLSEFRSDFNEIAGSTNSSASSLERIESHTFELVETISRIEKFCEKMSDCLMITTTLQEQVKRLEEKIANIERK